MSSIAIVYGIDYVRDRYTIGLIHGDLSAASTASFANHDLGTSLRNGHTVGLVARLVGIDDLSGLSIQLDLRSSGRGIHANPTLIRREGNGTGHSAAGELQVGIVMVVIDIGFGAIARVNVITTSESILCTNSRGTVHLRNGAGSNGTLRNLSLSDIAGIILQITGLARNSRLVENLRSRTSAGTPVRFNIDLSPFRNAVQLILQLSSKVVCR